MNIVLWILQLLLAALYLWHGWFMVAPPAEMLDMVNSTFGVGLRTFIGVAELLAAAGLILPGVTRILPRLVVWAATGLMIVMASAVVFHLFRGEVSSAISGAVTLALLTFVAYMRWKVKPISPRNSSPQFKKLNTVS